MRFKFNLVCLLLFVSFQSIAQTQKNNQFNSWWSYSGNHKLTDKISVHTLYSWRRNDFVKNWQQSLLRVGLNYQLTNNFSITPGYDWVVTFPYGEQPIPTRNTEHRFFEQFTLKNKIGGLSIKHRYRIEQRLFENKPLKNRFRYRLTFTLPLNKKESKENFFFVQIFDELFINYGKGVANHYFDQNWIYAGLGYKINKKSSVKLGYMNQFLPKSDGLKIENNHTFSVGYSYNFDFRSKKR